MSDPISNATAIVLGAVQGATEFLPVSSSGHVAVFGFLFGDREPVPMSMVVMLHAGTLIATLVVLRKEIGSLVMRSLRGLRAPRELVGEDAGRTALGVIVATVPTAVIGLLLEDPLEELAKIPWVLGLCFLVSAALVFSTRRGGGEALSLSLPRAFLVGVAQGLAVFPGVSRSGTTIAVAMLLGLRPDAAFTFSFLLSLPAVAGAVVLKLGEPGALEALGTAGWIGGAVALLVGTLALFLLRNLVKRGRFWTFALYLVPLGLALIGWDLFFRSVGR